MITDHHKLRSGYPFEPTMTVCKPTQPQLGSLGRYDAVLQGSLMVKVMFISKNIEFCLEIGDFDALNFVQSQYR